MARYDTAGDIINAAAVECGLTAVSDPFASSDQAFVQLVQLLTNAGRELVGLNQWQQLVRTYSLTTSSADTGQYDLPDDYGYFIDQTGWTPTNRLPLGGPLSAQDWTYIVGSDWNQYTIYVSFREVDNQIWIMPNNPVPDAIDITFEYVSRSWVREAGAAPYTYRDKVEEFDDVVLYEPILITKFLKLRFLEAKGFDTTSAVAQFTTAFASWVPKNKASPVLDLARRRTYPYLTWRNIPETNFGTP